MDAERVRAADGGKAVAEPQGLQEPPRQPLEFVGADRKAMAGLREAVEDRLEFGKRARAVGNMLAVVGNKRRIERIDVGSRGAAAFKDQRALDHAPRATADQGSRLRVRHGRQRVARKGEVERLDEVGGRVDQRAVEVEDDREHDFC